MSEKTERIVEKIKALTSVGWCPPEEVAQAIEWIRKNKFTSLRAAWSACERAHWMLWFIGKKDGKLSPQLHLAACACARTALRYIPKDEKRPRKAIETAERYARGKATKTELDAATALAKEADFIATWSSAWEFAHAAPVAAIIEATRFAIEAAPKAASREAYYYLALRNAAWYAALATAAGTVAGCAVVQTPEWRGAFDTKGDRTSAAGGIDAGDVGRIPAWQTAFDAALKKMANLIRKRIPKP